MTYKDFDFEIIAYYYPSNKIGYSYAMANKRRIKTWSVNDPAFVCGIEFIMNDNDSLKPGDIKAVKINVLSEKVFKELMSSGLRVYFGEIQDIRLGEIVALITGDV